MKQRIISTLIVMFCIVNIVKASDGWLIKADSKNNYNGVTLSNGRIGLVTGSQLFSLTDIVLNGVYDKEFVGGMSQIVRAPLFTNILLKIDGVEINEQNTTNWQQQLNMREAFLKTSVDHKDTNIEYTLRALRNLPYMCLSVVEITPSKNITIEVENRVSFTDELKNRKSNYKVLRDLEAYFYLNVSEAESRTNLNKLATASAFLFDGIRPEILGIDNNSAMSFKQELKAGTTYRFALVGAACSSQDFFDPSAEAQRMTIFAIQNTIDYLRDGHTRQWADLWQGDIIIEGCEQDQLDVRLALYNLYSFQREGSRLSIPPMGLSTITGYNGHIFWDSEIWMYPPMLVMNHKIARSHIDYRTDRLDKAMQRAEMFGYKGAMYPWESDKGGEEATPVWCLTGTFEHHITADIAIAFWNYYLVTKDLQWLRSEGYKVIEQIAHFWVSRTTENTDGSYSIRNVIGANEYAPNVNDNAFTNGAAKMALLNATEAAMLVGQTPNPKWKKIANNIKFHYLPNGETREHSRYNGEMIKQADVNLLAYPLGVIDDEQQIRKDLVYYEQKIDKVNGPAMGASILSIIYSRLGDKEKAYELFLRSFTPNKRPPFGVLSESASSNNPYFATGAGGMLQSVIFGFCGLEITDSGIKQHSSTLPSKWKSLTITGIGVERKTITVTKSK